MNAIFFHVACISPHWLSITDEIFSEIVRSKLYDNVDQLNIGMVGSAKDKAKLQKLLKGFDKVKINYFGTDFTSFEFPTVKLLSNFCKENPESKVFYCHTKGVSKDYDNPYWKYWRRYMISSCITQYCKHVDSLDSNDISGNMWTNSTHFAGNFWWANASHINELPDISLLQNKPETVWAGHSNEENKRLQCEMWIGKKKGIKVKEHGILNMKPSFGETVVGKVDDVDCPLNEMSFDKIYLINLEHRKDRLEQALKQFSSIGLNNVVRFPAVNAKQLGITKKGMDNPGLVGCFLSHYFIIQEAVINNYKRILIFEDDVTFVNGFNERLQYSLKQLPSDWELVYLGYTEREGVYTHKGKLSDNITLPNDPWGTQAYMIQGDGIRIMYENLQHIYDHIDIQMSRQIMPKLKGYELFPSLCPQSGMSSDIQFPQIEITTPKARVNRRSFQPIFN